jgi:hypothetical protein
MNDLVIEKGISIPPRKGRWMNALRSMEIGDSILFPLDIQPSTFFIAARRSGIKITSRKMPDGLRVWRVA